MQPFKPARFIDGRRHRRPVPRGQRLDPFPAPVQRKRGHGPNAFRVCQLGATILIIKNVVLQKHDARVGGAVGQARLFAQLFKGAGDVAGFVG